MAIGIIFSGMGSDGMLGVKAIKEKNGTVLVQDPAQAKFDSMPQNAINTGMVDFVAPAYDLPALLVDFEKNYYQLLSKKPSEKTRATSEVEKCWGWYAVGPATISPSISPAPCSAGSSGV